MKRLLIIFTTTLLSCSPVDKNNFLDKRSVAVDNLVLRNLSYFKDLNKDTLILTLVPFDICGSDQYVDVRPLFSKLKTKAINSGFKVVIEDTLPLHDPKKTKLYHLPHYSLTITVGSWDASICQIYFTKIDTTRFVPQKTQYFLQKDTTLEIN